MSPRALRIFVALVLAGLWGAGLGLAHLGGGIPGLERLEATATDFRTVLRGERIPPDIVTIAAIDDATVAREGGYPLPRASLAQLIDAIAALDPKVIALDILLVDPGPEAGDRLLADSLRGVKSVIAAAAVFPPGGRAASNPDGPLAQAPIAERLLAPLPVFAEATAVGVVNVATDQSGTPRFAPMLFSAGDMVAASLPLRVATLAIGKDPVLEPDGIEIGERLIRTDLGQRLPLSFYGPKGTINTVSAAVILDGKLEARQVAGKIVVIGVTVTGGGDVFPTPFDPVLPGVEVISTAITHLMTGDGLIRDRTVRRVDAGTAVALPVLLVGLLAWRRNAPGLAAAAIVLLLWLAANFVAFYQGYWLSATLPLAAAIPAVILYGGAELWVGRRQARHFAIQSDMLQRVQAPGLTRFLADDPDFLTAPVRQDAAVVFIDLSGFTGLTERLGPSATRNLIEPFYELVDEEATACGGAITGFMGDGLMILFGLPKPGDDDAANAARCAIRLFRRTKDWIALLPPEIAARLGVKIGANFGEIVASRLGRGQNQQIAATGDAVNVASRLMEIGAAEGADIAVGAALRNAAGDRAFAGGVLQGPVETPVRGRTGTVDIWFWRAVES